MEPLSLVLQIFRKKEEGKGGKEEMKRKKIF
jgi:hypothetical protein